MNSHKSAGRIHFVANCLYGTHIAGGDIHFFQLALGAIKAGFQLHFFGGHALAYHLQKQEISATQTVTDSRMLPRINAESLGGQLRLLWDYIGRFFRTICNLGKIQKDDFAYAVTDYWFDALPVIFCRAHRKVMVWHMQAPSLKEIIFRTRADVDAKRLASLYFWASQNLTLWLFCRCANKRLIYINPCMRDILLAKGYREEEILMFPSGSLSIIRLDPVLKGTMMWSGWDGCIAKKASRICWPHWTIWQRAFRIFARSSSAM